MFFPVQFNRARLRTCLRLIAFPVEDPLPTLPLSPWHSNRDVPRTSLPTTTGFNPVETPFQKGRNPGSSHSSKGETRSVSETKKPRWQFEPAQNERLRSDVLCFEAQSRSQASRSRAIVETKQSRRCQVRAREERNAWIHRWKEQGSDKDVLRSCCACFGLESIEKGRHAVPGRCTGVLEWMQRSQNNTRPKRHSLYR